MRQAITPLLPFGVIGVGAFLAAAVFIVSLYQPVEPGSRREVVVEIPAGASTAEISALLKEHGLIKSEEIFRALARVARRDGKLKAGEYRLSPGMSLAAILDKLERGEVIVRSLTIPEGLTAEDVARLLEERGYAERSEALAAFSDISILREAFGAEALPPGPGGPDVRYPLEGYLFPDTYHFTGHPSARQLAAIMVRRFREAWTPEMARRARELGLDVHQVLTLASIVEREARVDAERSIIAGVYWNRLRLGMRLDADPTVRYALRKQRAPLVRQDLDVDSPYNTYRRVGLPPGPIASPGLASIRAVLFPADVPYLYFVARPDGTHDFSVTLAEHNRKVARLSRQR